jgi:SAM-dependent methyltransferase
MPVTKEEFKQVWPGGYTETWEFSPQARTQISERIKALGNREQTALEIGCGSGRWTRDMLVPYFKQVICLDVISRPKELPDTVRFIELGDRDYSCGGLPDASVDFVYSYGVFCHLFEKDVQTYLLNIRRVLKPGCRVLLMFGSPWPGVENSGWSFYATEDVVRRMMSLAGLAEAVNVVNGRDLVMLAVAK